MLVAHGQKTHRWGRYYREEHLVTYHHVGVAAGIGGGEAGLLLLVGFKVVMIVGGADEVIGCRLDRIQWSD